jgi:small subunit ribosomal protein S24e
MEVQIEAVRENPLLDRRRVTLKVDHEGEATPSREDIKSRFAAEKTLTEDNIEVGTIHTGYGRNSSKTELKVYEDFDYSEDLEEEAETTSETVEVSEDYEEIVSGTITDGKDAIEDLDNPDYDALIKAEEEDKNRTTFIDWLESQKE